MNPNRRARSRRRARKRQKPLNRRRAYQERRVSTLPPGDLLQVPPSVRTTAYNDPAYAHVIAPELLGGPFSDPAEPVLCRPDVTFIDWSWVDPKGDPTIPLIGETGDDYWQRQRDAQAASR